MNASDLSAWLALNSIEGIGPVSFVRLVERFGHPQAALNASTQALESTPGLTRPVIEAVLAQQKNPPSYQQEIQVLQKNNIHVLTYQDTNYPVALRQISSFPPLLYAWGNLEALQMPNLLGVVGSRDVTEYGVMVCRRLVRELAENGIGIVSGFARGTDITAHEATLAANGVTLAVLGSGLGQLYPASSRKFATQIIKKGLILSEFPFNLKPQPGCFPRRNRIISGLSRGVLVIEADEKSGAMITAQNALDQNRDLFAVPGSVLSAKSKGCHRLLQQGAKLVMDVSDILDEWQFGQRPSITVSFNDPLEAKIYESCRAQGVTADELINQTGLPSNQVMMLLTKLELEGRLKGLAGGKYQSL